MDTRTLFFFSTLVLGVNALAVHVTSLRTEIYRGFRHLNWFFTLITVAQVLLALRGVVHDFYSIFCGNLVAVVAICLFSEGLFLFHDLPAPRPNKVIIPLAALLMVLVGWYTFVTPHVSARVALTMSFDGLFLWILAAALLRAGRAWRNLPEAVHFLTLVCFGLFGFVRAANALAHPVADLFHEGWTLPAFIILLTVFVIINMVSCIFLSLERKNRELVLALDEVRKLSGLIPICAGCKKVRDDSGYWNQLEAYFAERTGARFSHGLCPECALELYPEAAEEIERLAVRRSRN